MLHVSVGALLSAILNLFSVCRECKQDIACHHGESSVSCDVAVERSSWIIACSSLGHPALLAALADTRLPEQLAS
jgi:hypothetical protein